MKIAARLDRIEQREGGGSAEVRHAERFLTALVAFGQHSEDVTPETATRIRETARRIGAGGLPTHMRRLSDALREEGPRCD